MESIMIEQDLTSITKTSQQGSLNQNRTDSAIQASSNGRTAVYLCEDSIEGIFTGIYKAWEAGTSHTDVRIQAETTMSFFEDYIQVETNDELAAKVASSIQQKLSSDVYHTVYQGCMSDDEKKASCIYHFLQKAFRVGPEILNHLQDNDVATLFELSRRVGRESHFYLEFTRFEELENGVLCCKINPKSNVVPSIANHFSDRLHCENWIILDTTRNLAAVHKAHQGFVLTNNITEESLSSFCGISKDELIFQQLWQRFFDTIAIKERVNPALQRNMMPLRYRKYMKAENHITIEQS
jgi:probable DNA metabolism protein